VRGAYFISWRRLRGLVALAAILLPVLLAFALALRDRFVAPAAVPGPIFRGSSETRKLALTFHVDRGEEHLPALLRCLAEHGVRATFFLGGRWTEEHADLARQIAAAGHEIGTRGHSRPHPDRMTRAANQEELRRSCEVILRLTGCELRFFAPPYGECGPAVLEAAALCGLRVVMWSIDGSDRQHPDPGSLADRVVRRAHNGAIVLLHPTEPAVEALPVIIRELRAQGYQPGTVGALLAEE